MRSLQILALTSYGLSALSFIYLIVKFKGADKGRLRLATNAAYLFAFIGLLLMRLDRGYYSQLSLVALACLAASYLTISILTRLLRR